MTETNHIWSPPAMEKDQDSKARLGLMGIIIYRKWDSFGEYEIQVKRVYGCILKDRKCKVYTSKEYKLYRCIKLNSMCKRRSLSMVGAILARRSFCCAVVAFS